MKLSSTNATLDTAETTTSICIGTGGKLACETDNASKSGMRHVTVECE